MRGTGEQRQYWRTGNKRKHIFYFWETMGQANLFQGNKGTGTPPLEGLTTSSIIITGISNAIYTKRRLCFPLVKIFRPI